MHYGIEAGKTVGDFSLEMSKEQLFLRMLTGEARVDAHRFHEQLSRIAQRYPGRIHDAKVFIDDTPGVGILEMRAKARRLKLRHGLDMLVVDYLQLMQGRGRFEIASRNFVELACVEFLRQRAADTDSGAEPAQPRPEARGDHRPQLFRTCANPAPSSRTRTS